jgi:hypothetical protein
MQAAENSHFFQRAPQIARRNGLQNQPAFVAGDVCRVAALNAEKQATALGIAEIGMRKNVFRILSTFHNLAADLEILRVLIRRDGVLDTAHPQFFQHPPRSGVVGHDHCHESALLQDLEGVF